MGRDICAFMRSGVPAVDKWTTKDDFGKFADFVAQICDFFDLTEANPHTESSNSERRVTSTQPCTNSGPTNVSAIDHGNQIEKDYRVSGEV